MLLDEDVVKRWSNPKPTTIKIGDWISFGCYEDKGVYGLVVDIKPHYSVHDMDWDNFSIRKGDYLGDDILFKKIKLGSRIKKPRSGLYDDCKCKKVTDEQLKQIEKYFEDNPDRKKIFFVHLLSLKQGPFHIFLTSMKHRYKNLKIL